MDLIESHCHVKWGVAEGVCRLEGGEGEGGGVKEGRGGAKG